MFIKTGQNLRFQHFVLQFLLEYERIFFVWVSLKISKFIHRERNEITPYRYNLFLRLYKTYFHSQILCRFSSNGFPQNFKRFQKFSTF